MSGSHKLWIEKCAVRHTMSLARQCKFIQRVYRVIVYCLLAAHTCCPDGTTSDASIRSTDEPNNYYSLQNESISDTLLDKFSNLTAAQNSINDRIIARITIAKDAPSKMPVNRDARPAATLSGGKRTGQHRMGCEATGDASADQPPDDADNGMTLGISIVQGSDNNVYVKDLVKNGPGDRHGVLIGDQVSDAKQNTHKNIGDDMQCE